MTLRPSRPRAACWQLSISLYQHPLPEKVTLADRPIIWGEKDDRVRHQCAVQPCSHPQLEKAECMIHHWGNTIASKLFWAFLLCNNLQVFCIFGNWTACSVCFGYLERKIVHGWWGWVVHVSLLILLDFFRQCGEEKKKKSSVTRTHAAYSSYCFTYHVQFSVLCHIIRNTKTKAGSHLKLIFVKDFFFVSMQVWDKKYICIYINIYTYVKNWDAYVTLGTRAIKYFLDKQRNEINNMV